MPDTRSLRRADWLRARVHPMFPRIVGELPVEFLSTGSSRAARSELMQWWIE